MTAIQGFVANFAAPVLSSAARRPLFHRRPFLAGKGTYPTCWATAALLSCGVSALGLRGAKMAATCGSLQVHACELDWHAFVYEHNLESVSSNCGHWQVEQFPCLSDNYGYLIHDPNSGATAAIDTPDASAYLAALKRKGWTLSYILNTHHHHDHAGGNLELKRATGCKIIGPKYAPNRQYCSALVLSYRLSPFLPQPYD